MEKLEREMQNEPFLNETPAQDITEDEEGILRVKTIRTNPHLLVAEE